MHHARRRHGDQDRIQRGDDDFTLEGAYCRLSRWDFDGTPKTGQSPRRGDTDSVSASTDDDLGEDAKASRKRRWRKLRTIPNVIALMQSKRTTTTDAGLRTKRYACMLPQPAIPVCEIVNNVQYIWREGWF